MERYEEEWDCPECNFSGIPITDNSNYGSDRDGNRGREMLEIRCPECGYEKGRFV